MSLEETLREWRAGDDPQYARSLMVAAADLLAEIAQRAKCLLANDPPNRNRAPWNRAVRDFLRELAEEK